MTLPSNSSMDFNPHNTASQFTTKLSELVELEGDWEVGLLETSLPGKVENVGKGTHYYVLPKTDDALVKFAMRSGIYSSIQQVVTELRRIGRRYQGSVSVPVVNWEYSPHNQRISFEFNANNANDVVSLWFNSDLATMLGYNENRQYAYRITPNKAERPMKFSAGFDNIFIYCDVLVSVLVGDTKTPLLRLVNRKTDVGQSHHSVEHVAFNPVQYVPLQNKCFDTVTIHLMTDHGEPMPFAPGKSDHVWNFAEVLIPT